MYGILVASMLNDVRRTEIFARLAKPGGGSAKTTLCSPSRSWWNDPVDALRKGTRSYALLSASMMYILALSVSPLSAGLLSPTDEQISRPNMFHRAITTNFTWQQDSEDEIMFRTISGAVLDQATSAWLTNTSAILPFWPHNYTSAPLDAKFTTDLQIEQWQAPTVAYTVELNCEPMSLRARYNATYNDTEISSENYTFLELESPDDCVITLADDSESTSIQWMQHGGGWWAEAPFYNTSALQGMSNSTSACGDRTMFFCATPASEPFGVQAQLCSHAFYSSEILATVTVNQSSTNVTFDQQESFRNRQLLDPSVYNISQLRESFFSSNWTARFLTSGSEAPVFDGPLISIAASSKYNSDPARLINSTTLPQEANRIYQQFLGEMLLAALSRGLEKSAETVLGKLVVLERRIVVNTGFGIALTTIMLISSVCVVLVAYFTSLERRVLNLIQDPGTISAATALVSADPNVRAAFETTDTLSQEALAEVLRKQRYILAHGSLFLVGEDDMSYEKALSLKLWYGAAGDAMKLLQPYVSMSRRPVPATISVLAEYVNTPIGIATPKAISNAHWTLALVALGALATEICMSALWQREVGSLSHPVNITRRLELRAVPKMFKHEHYTSHGRLMDTTHGDALSNTYLSSLQSWIYNAAVEMSQSGSTPAWSRDSWSFVPLDHDDIAAATSSVETSDIGIARNITFETYALSARLECRVIDYPANVSAWLRSIDFSNKTIDPATNMSVWNSTNSPPNLDHGYTLTGWANIGPRSGHYVCCANDTFPGDAAIGYWNNRLWVGDPSEGTYKDMQMTMTAKLIVGRPLEKLYQSNPPETSNDPPLFIWPEPPVFQMVNCTPFIEYANASVNADVQSGFVHSYEILGPPQNATQAWIDNYLIHNTSADYAGEWEIAYGSGANQTTYDNLTVSWGYLFWDTLLNSGRASEIRENQLTAYSSSPESLTDRSFNFRIKGLNVDFMTYSMLALANNSKEALLNTDTFIDLANRTFGVFFKHFVSDNVTSEFGGRAYQPIGERLPWSLGPIVPYASGVEDQRLADYQGALELENHTTPSSSYVNATIHVPVEQLVMSPVSVFLCLSLLVFLTIVTTITFATNHRRHKELPRNVDTLASTIAFIHGSERLIAFSTTAPKTKPWYKALFSVSRSQNSQAKVRMGTFTSTDGLERWGIEIVDTTNHNTTAEAESAVGLLEIRPKGQRSSNGDVSSTIQTDSIDTSRTELSDTTARHLEVIESGSGRAETGEKERLVQGSQDTEISRV
ncbi:hypothetical protein E4T39_06562 [Aureobasidium subglaciale]|nr:hypothetical protein E4T39_06562 [Aureobasidium subglaciale]